MNLATFVSLGVLCLWSCAGKNTPESDRPQLLATTTLICRENQTLVYNNDTLFFNADTARVRQMVYSEKIIGEVLKKLGQLPDKAKIDSSLNGLTTRWKLPLTNLRINFKHDDPVYSARFLDTLCAVIQHEYMQQHFLWINDSIAHAEKLNGYFSLKAEQTHHPDSIARYQEQSIALKERITWLNVAREGDFTFLQGPTLTAP